MLNRKKKVLKDKCWVLLFIVVVVLVYTPLLGAESVWGDEAFTLVTIRSSFSDIIKITAADVHPPFYYLIAKFAAEVFGYSLVVQKIVSIVPIILTIIVGKVLLNRSNLLVGNAAGWICMITSLIIVPDLLHESIEIRMYSWATFFITTAALYSYYIFSIEKYKIKECLILAVIGLGAGYTHYFALITICFIYLYFFIASILKNKSNYKFILLLSGLFIIGYIPWLFIFLSQLSSVSQDYWIEPLGVKQVVIYLVHPYNGIVWFLIIPIVCFVLFSQIFNLMKKQQTNVKVITGCVFFSIYYLCVLSGVILSALIRPIFVVRYADPCISLLWIGIFILLEDLNIKNMQKNILKVILVCVLGLNFIPVWFEEYRITEYTGYEEIVQMMLTQDYINSYVDSNISGFSWTILPYFLPDNEVKTIEEGVLAEINSDRNLIYFCSSETFCIEETMLKEYELEYEHLLHTQVYTSELKDVYVFKIHKTPKE